ncbi:MULTISPECIES: ATP-dependent RNA helicase RhlB [unclassified Methylophaga]|jgi:ATP-dependent RNA helicase RhlB|uniref:ATP-dependent RNA helicase RhlB n=1 Tax=unclassified Methylophaga TaxID=2629249 RepID=UPI000C8E2013|nr:MULTISPECIES: ATP-dependent RNA helicase RhlB [unclassified Methylophaga]MAK66480.1 ATP-dependent RNA helicase RhlB [Methylophaga sp.]MAY17173.1 ATP-dependent RNA helicase RhlB [Methylophaga sp.]MBN46033.1 ATP-dependent RNA helicase RhlB [Methylophaga sp.]|tara:strand:+ start:72452 stop:73765 length:1314 start_codon:yes stop_codon:yes gene_type:complete
MSAHLTDTAFSSLPLHPLLQKGLQQAGFEFCTPIQAKSLPLLLANHDVAGQAQTGTGKTIAFLLATFQRLLNTQDAQNSSSKQPRALILAPTRELAIQIVKDAELLNSHAGLRIVIAHGGKDYQRQRDAITDGCDVLIGTPGRLMDFHKQRVFNLNKIEVVVLDEADRMFDLGFIKDVRFFLRRLPEPGKRLGMLFSATLSYKVSELAYEHMNNPEKVQVEPEKMMGDRIEEWVYYPSNEEKIPLLLALIKRIQPLRSIVFVNTKHVAERVWGYLEGNGYKAALLSGDVPQKKRESLLKHFQDGEFPYLVATDVAARGLHIPEVSHVFNFDLPQDAEDYVHRTGRTARAGASGIAISLACEEYAFSLPDIEQYIKHKLPVAQSSDEQLETPKPRIRAERHPAPRHQNKARGNSKDNRSQRNKHSKGPKKPVTSDANQ